MAGTNGGNVEGVCVIKMVSNCCYTVTDVLPYISGDVDEKYFSRGPIVALPKPGGVRKIVSSSGITSRSWKAGGAVLAGVDRRGADSSTVRNVVNESVRRGGQARNIVIDARGTGLSQAEAERGIGRAIGIARGKVDGITLIGDDYVSGWGPAK